MYAVNLYIYLDAFRGKIELDGFLFSAHDKNKTKHVHVTFKLHWNFTALTLESVH
jgi:hypothetical protein